MRSKGALIAVYVCAVLVVSIALSSFLTRVQEELSPTNVFSFHGMEITLPRNFEQVYLDGEDQQDSVGFRGTDMAILAVEEKYTMYPDMEEYTVEAFSVMIMEMSGMDPALLQNDDGLIFAEREDEKGYSLLAFYSDADGFWEILFRTETKTSAECRDSFLEWAHSVQFHA